MQKAAIVVGEEYALREGRNRDAPLQRVRILEHVRGKKWKVQWIEPNAGLVDYVEAQYLVVRWGDSAAFISDEAADRKIRDDNERAGYDDDSPVVNALHSVFDRSGENVSFYRGVLSAAPDAIDRIRHRAKMDDRRSYPLQYVDRNGKLHIRFEDALQLAMAFCAAEPASVLPDIEATEQSWSRDPTMTELLTKYRPAWALVRRWSGQDSTAAFRAEIERLRRLVSDAVDELERAGLDRAAQRLRIEISRGDKEGSRH